MRIEPVLKFFLPLMISGLMLAPILLQPKPALADGPVCISPNMTIPDSPGDPHSNGAVPGPVVTSTIIVTNAGPIADLNLYISATHTYVGDLVFTLTHKIGDTVLGSTAVISRAKGIRPGGAFSQPACTGDNINIILDDEASLSVHDDCNEDVDNPDDPTVLAYIDGESYRPYTNTLGVPGALYIFDGQDQIGSWELTMNDNFEFDGPGTLHQWCLLFNEPGPDLQIDKQANVASITPGGAITYNLTYGNNGTQANNAVITETLPAHTSFSPSNLPGWQQVGATNQYIYQVGNVAGLSSGHQITFTVTVNKPLPAGVNNLTNVVEIGHDGTQGQDFNTINNQDTEVTVVNAAPNLQINKTDGNISVKPGGLITYTLYYTNAGSQTATQVVISDTIPSNTMFRSDLSSAGWSCPNNNAGSICTLNIASLATNGVGSSVTFVVKVNDSLPAGVTAINNTAKIGDNGANGTDLNLLDNEDTEATPIDSGSGETQFHVYLPLVVKN